MRRGLDNKSKIPEYLTRFVSLKESEKLSRQLGVVRATEDRGRVGDLRSLFNWDSEKYLNGFRVSFGVGLIDDPDDVMVGSNLK